MWRAFLTKMRCQALAEHFSLPAAKVGYLTAAYPAGMFGALFVWPKLSDLIGRQTVLCLTLFGVGLGFVMQVCITLTPCLHVALD